MFQLTKEEGRELRYQSGTSNPVGRGGRRYRPYAFTEQGVAMRAFVRLRELISSHADLAAKIDGLEEKYDRRFRVVFQALRQLMAPADGEPSPAKPIGFGRS